MEATILPMKVRTVTEDATAQMEVLTTEAGKRSDMEVAKSDEMAVERLNTKEAKRRASISKSKKFQQ